MTNAAPTAAPRALPTPALPRSARGRWRLGLTAAALVGCAGIAALAGGYGLAWDEAVQWRYGELCLDYFASGLQDQSFADFLNLRHYGALFEMIAAFAARAAGDDAALALTLRHACIALTALAGVLATACLGRRLGGPLAGAAAGALLVVDPPFFGHAFQNSKDVPFAAGFVCTVLAASRLFGAQRPRTRDALFLGAAAGLTLAVRIGGIVPLAAVIGAGALWWVSARGRPGARLGSVWVLARPLAIAAVVAWAVAIAAWPWAHRAPLANPLDSLRTAVAFPVRIPVLFAGDHLSSDALPARYVAELLLLTTPLPELLFAIAGLALALRAIVRRPRARATLAAALVVAWLVVPLAAFAAARPNVYDGMRHFLFLRPAVALLGGLGLARAAARLHAGATRRRAAVGAALAALLLSPVVDLVRLHPYQATWFNGLAGGVAGAWTRFDTDTGALAYREAMEWITSSDPRRPLRVLVAANDYSRPAAERYAPVGVQVEALWAGGIDGALPGPLPDGIDYYLATTRVGLAANFPAAPIVQAIGREGAIFAVVRGREARSGEGSDHPRDP